MHDAEHFMAVAFGLINENVGAEKRSAMILRKDNKT